MQLSKMFLSNKLIISGADSKNEVKATNTTFSKQKNKKCKFNKFNP